MPGSHRVRVDDIGVLFGSYKNFNFSPTPRSETHSLTPTTLEIGTDSSFFS
jgi:hypothetical protein